MATAAPRGLLGRMTMRKSVAQVQRETETSELKRSLGPWNLVFLGIGCAFAGLCYAELSSTLPVSGSAYTYSYATIGEFGAWVMGTLLLLEYGLAASVVAVGWSGHMVRLLGDTGSTNH